MTTMEVQCDIKLKYNPTSNATSGSHCKFSRKCTKNEFLLKNRRQKRNNNECERSRCSESRLRNAMQHEILRIYSCLYLLFFPVFLNSIMFPKAKLHPDLQKI
ncbi:PREDICTED: uncharacterized protein LOC105144189 [Acromyrmex echinatior]|uniref:uncharacterized protein LOC105144189 n=1 Tax=Acromyrmex echinatior TaxID=103372 RepID=UPI000580FF09|nr:PREDICTED: uncharacterized protein LOC105144189 [Acromyrmex echinatior]